MSAHGATVGPMLSWQALPRKAMSERCGLTDFLCANDNHYCVIALVN
jgi:hypothetical protein